jgi:DNA-binding transcriptional regulator LsrR (DeoR family)
MNKPKLSKQQLISYMEEGLTRPEIAQKLEVTVEEVNKYFRFFNIKGKAKKKLKYELVDETEITDKTNGQSRQAELEVHI